MFNLTPDICFKCRSERYEKERNVGCEIEGRICNYTGYEVDDEKYFMDVDEFTSYIASTWHEIVNISKREFYRIEGKKETKNIYLPTMDKIDIYFENKNWDIIKYDRKNIFYLVSLFHTTYIETVKNVNFGSR